jgi:hypothetical protein
VTAPNYDRKRSAASLAALRSRIPRDVLDALREAHEQWGDCSAWSEGQYCCLADHLLEPPEES